MKKQLLIAAIVATMSVPVFADVSISGNARIRFANITGTDNKSNDSQDKRVRINVTGTVGDTSVHATLRNNGNTMWGGGNSQEVKMQTLYFKTKVGGIDIKAGNYWHTVGIGMASTVDSYTHDAVKFLSTQGGWNVGLQTSQFDANKTILLASGKIGSFNVGFNHNSGDYTDVHLKGEVVPGSGITVTAEKFIDKNKTKEGRIAGTSSTTYLQVGGKSGGVSWDLASLKNGKGTDSSGKKTGGINDGYDMLGSRIIGVNYSTSQHYRSAFTSVVGGSVAIDAAGGSAKLVYLKLKNKTNPGATNVLDGTSTEIIYSRPLAGANLVVNYGILNPSNVAGSTKVVGVAVDVSF